MEIKHFFLETERLILRAFRPSDLESFLPFRNDPAVAEYKGWELPYSHERGAEFLEMMRTRHPLESGQWYQAAIVTKDEKEFIGDIAHMFKKDDPRQVYIGCTVAKKHWQKGFGVEAVRRHLEWLFDEINVHRVIARTDVENDASINTLERLGLRREAHFVQNIWLHGRWTSEYHYAMLDREWEKIKSTA
ncbi:MAG: hypothetical protein HFACDABA_00242 [Anaerolineales bacterium]|nr:hypothetical protein [Anaerolineales bacterium]